MTDTAQLRALLPCPFCGGAGEILETQGGQASAFATLYRADCSERGCADMPWESDKSDTIAAWNRRAGQSHADAALLEALVAAPIIGAFESPERFRARQDVWLDGVCAPAIAAAKGARPMTKEQHALERTSPKGGPLLGLA